MGNNGIKRGRRTASSGQLFSWARARDTPNCTRRAVTPSRIAIALMHTPWRTSQSQTYSLAMVARLSPRPNLSMRPLARFFFGLSATLPALMIEFD